jgi:2-polyprenyl-3-methyl-5-hydroxy-6-metoxy-1,4-benzoquinol methylase
MNTATCPLCGDSHSALFHEDSRRPYLQCATCQLVFVPQTTHLPPADEKSRYDMHQNDSNDAGYRSFLNRICAPMVARMAPGLRGLDFGCGPGPTLSLLFQEAGFSCANYDPFYANDPTLLEQTYDFLSCSEAIEHFYEPRKEFELFLKLVKPGGLIGIMTQLVTTQEAFKKWFYIADETHVCYFSEFTFRWLADQHGLTVEFPEKSVILFRR